MVDLHELQLASTQYTHQPRNLTLSNPLQVGESLVVLLLTGAERVLGPDTDDDALAKVRERHAKLGQVAFVPRQDKLLLRRNEASCPQLAAGTRVCSLQNRNTLPVPLDTRDQRGPRNRVCAGSRGGEEHSYKGRG